MSVHVLVLNNGEYQTWQSQCAIKETQTLTESVFKIAQSMIDDMIDDNVVLLN